jgi:hypothetical protein
MMLYIDNSGGSIAFVLFLITQSGLCSLPIVDSGAVVPPFIQSHKSEA